MYDFSEHSRPLGLTLCPSCGARVSARSEYALRSHQQGAQCEFTTDLRQLLLSGRMPLPSSVLAKCKRDEKMCEKIHSDIATFVKGGPHKLSKVTYRVWGPLEYVWEHLDPSRLVDFDRYSPLWLKLIEHHPQLYNAVDSLSLFESFIKCLEKNHRKLAATEPRKIGAIVDLACVSYTPVLVFCQAVNELEITP